MGIFHLQKKLLHNAADMLTGKICTLSLYLGVSGGNFFKR